MIRMFSLVILIIVLATTALLSVELRSAADAIVARVGDREFTYGEYRLLLTNYFNYWEDQWQRPLTSEDRKQLYKRCWDDLINRHIYDVEIKRRKMVVSDQELEAEIIRNPPEAVKQLSDLQTNGRFDMQKYRQALDQRPEFRTFVTDYTRAVYRYHKLIGLVKAEAVINADSLKQVWFRDMDTASARIIFFDYKKLTDISVTDEEISAFYQQNIEDYSRSDGRRLRYIRLPRQPSQTDISVALARADSLYQKLLAGADFTSMAAEYSDDPGSAHNSGNLGWFGRGVMIPEFERACFDNPPGALVRPFASQYGWHIVEVLDSRVDTNGQTEVNARHILIRTEISAQTLRDLKILQTQIYHEALNMGLDAAAQEHDLEVWETPFFNINDRTIPGIGTMPSLVSYAFDHPVGSFTVPFSNPNGDFFVGQIADSSDVYHLPLESVRREVTAQATTSKRVNAMREFARDFHRRYTPDVYFEQAVTENITVIEHAGIRHDSSIPLIGKIDKLNQAILSTDEGSFTDLIEDGKFSYLTLVTERVKPTEQLWIKEKDAFLTGAREEIQTRYFTNWYYRQFQALHIEDNRHKYFDSEGNRLSDAK